MSNEEIVKLIKITMDYGQLEQLVTEIEKISGYSLLQLKSMFLAGWTLTPPERSMSMAELEKFFGMKP